MHIQPLQSEFAPTPFAAGPLSGELQWFAVHTRSKHEMKVKAQLQGKKIHVFLPMLKELRRWSDRRKLIEQPLFPGYVFVRMDEQNEENRISVLRTAGVVQFVGIQGNGTPIPEKQIENVQTLIASEIQFGLSPFLRVGQKVRIRGGCLDGIEGILTARNADRSVVVSVDLIQRSLSIRVSGFDLEMV
jgi:transcription antitermination factor NusG